MSKRIADNLNELTNATQEYVEATIAYHKLDLYKKIMLAVVSSVHKQLVAFTALLSFIFLSFGLAIYLGGLFGSTYLGYVAVGGFYIVLCLVVIVFLKPVVERVVLKNFSTKWLNVDTSTNTTHHEKGL